MSRHEAPAVLAAEQAAQETKLVRKELIKTLLLNKLAKQFHCKQYKLDREKAREMAQATALQCALANWERLEPYLLVDLKYAQA